jgi:hypothetical protein
MIEASNSNFYSDQIELNDETKSDFLEAFTKGYSTPLSFYIANLEGHLEALKQVAGNNPLVNNIRIAWNPSVADCKLTGTSPWTQDKIDEFEGAMKDKPQVNNELEQMKVLIAKYLKEATLEVAKSYNSIDIQYSGAK